MAVVVAAERAAHYSGTQLLQLRGQSELVRPEDCDEKLPADVPEGLMQ